MTVRFKGADLQPVLAEALANHCRLVLAKDQGAYFLSETGESRPDGRRKLLAYGVGCNPDADAFDDWWSRVNDEFGGDDFGEFFEPQNEVFALVAGGGYDLDVSATETHFNFTAVPVRAKR